MVMEQRQSLGRKVQARARCHLMRRSSQNAARMLLSLATRGGCLHNVVARFQRASDAASCRQLACDNVTLSQTQQGCCFHWQPEMVASTMWRHASSVPVMRHPAASWHVIMSLFPKRSKDAAFTGNQRWLPPQCGGALPACQ